MRVHTTQEAGVLCFCYCLDAAPVKQFEGHKDAVSGVIFLKEHLISISWDG